MRDDGTLEGNHGLSMFEGMVYLFCDLYTPTLKDRQHAINPHNVPKLFGPLPGQRCFGGKCIAT